MMMANVYLVLSKDVCYARTELHVRNVLIKMLSLRMGNVYVVMKFGHSTFRALVPFVKR